MPYATGTASGHDDLLEKFRLWICGYGTAAAAVPDGGNTGDGTVTGIDTTPDTITETWTLTCTVGGPVGTFTVTGSVSGAQASATVGTPYSNDFLSFTLNDGAVDFIVGDEFTIATTISAMSDDGTAWEEQTFASEVVTGLPWTRSGTTFTITQASHTFNAGETINISNCSSSGQADGAKTIVTDGASTYTFTGSSTKSGLSWSRSGSTITVTWTDHGFANGATATVSASSDATATGNNSETLLVVNANTLTFTGANAGSTSGTLTMTLPTSGSIDVTADENHVYLKGLGNGGTDEIFVQLRSYQNAGAGYYNIEVRGATGFSSGVGMTRVNQAGISSGIDMSMWSGSIPYWFVANGRRFIIVAKVSTIYESCYAGFILPTGLPSEYPYPLAIGATQGSTQTDYSDTSSNHRAFFDPGNGTSAPYNLLLLSKAGSWRGFSNWSGSSVQKSGNFHRVTPWGAARALDTNNGAPIYPNLNAGVIDSGSTYTLFPGTLVGRNASPASEDIFGDFDGVFHVSGHNNASENIVQAGGVDHLVVQSGFRTGKADYAAIALE